MKRPKLYQRIITGALALVMLLSSMTPAVTAFAAEADHVPEQAVVVEAGDSVILEEAPVSDETETLQPSETLELSEEPVQPVESQTEDMEPTPEPTEETVRDTTPEATDTPVVEPTVEPETEIPPENTEAPFQENTEISENETVEDAEIDLEEESSAEILKRVTAARTIQLERYKGTDITCNAQLPPSLMSTWCTPTEGARDLLRRAFETLGLTARSHDKLLRLARTIADLAGSPQIDLPHVAEAIQYRELDGKYWR